MRAADIRKAHRWLETQTGIQLPLRITKNDAFCDEGVTTHLGKLPWGHKYKQYLETHFLNYYGKETLSHEENILYSLFHEWGHEIANQNPESTSNSWGQYDRYIVLENIEGNATDIMNVYIELPWEREANTIAFPLFAKYLGWKHI